MKKTIFLTSTLVFALTLGVAYAYEGDREKGSTEPSNGITNFTGSILDAESDVGTGGMPLGSSSVEGAGAGGLSAGDAGLEPINGITDFSGSILDAESDIGIAGAAMGDSSVESSGAGGLRAGGVGSESFNGITDFAGRVLDAESDIGM